MLNSECFIHMYLLSSPKPVDCWHSAASLGSVETHHQFQAPLQQGAVSAASSAFADSRLRQATVSNGIAYCVYTGSEPEQVATVTLTVPSQTLWMTHIFCTTIS